MLNGILVVHKEKGYTSHDVVAKLRGICKQKKIGHTGTLDPDATGVLPVCLGKATKVCDFLTDSSKEYRAVMHLGLVTDTQDITGEILERKPVTVNEEQVRAAIMGFVGDYMQVPPMYSALKVNGQKLCDLARKGVEVERKARQITIFSIQIEEICLPFVTMKIACSKGTYIRTLCHDIGAQLGVGACMEKLCRTKAAGFLLENAHSLSEIELAAKNNSLVDMLIPVDKVFSDYPAVTVKKEFEVLYSNGNPLQEKMFAEASVYKEGPIRVYDEEGQFIGIFAYKNEKRQFSPIKMFLN